VLSPPVTFTLSWVALASLVVFLVALRAICRLLRVFWIVFVCCLLYCSDYLF
jgi:hypothetical protein